MKQTKHFGFKKPDITEYIGPESFNENADVIDEQLHLSQIHREDETVHIGSDTKEIPADADSLPLVDSADGNKGKRLRFANLKAALGNVFASLTHSHGWSAITGKPSAFTPSKHKSSHKTGGSDALTPADIGAASESDLNVHKINYATDTTAGHIKLSDIPEIKVDNTTVFLVNDGVLTLTDPNKPFFYDTGDECMPLTGGWVQGYTSGIANYFKSDFLKISTSNTTTSKGTWETALKIDLSNLSNLYIEWEQTSPRAPQYVKSIFGVASTAGTSVTEAELTKFNNFTKAIDCLDISALNGSYHILVKISIELSGSAGAVKAFRIWGKP